MSTFVSQLLAFGRLLRRLGLDVHTGRLLDVIDALQHVDVSRREDVYHTCRALRVLRREDFAAFDRAFQLVWGQRASAGTGRPRDADAAATAGDTAPPAARPPATARPAGAGEAEGSAPDDRVAGTWSDAGGLKDKDFGTFTEDEIAQAHDALERLTWSPGARRTRRWVAGRGARLDLRRALARSPRTGGDVVVLPRLRRRMRPRPVVLLCDISGSMERYSRMLLHFSHAIHARHRRLEVFVFSTHLTRLTTELRDRRLEPAIAAASRAVPDWSGGTRIGESLRQFHRQWKRRVMHGGPVVLLISDGWDRGDPELLREQMARLRRSCHRLIWLNPLVGTEDYAPLTRGLQAALPYVDDFLPARTLSDLRDLALHLNAADAR